LLVGCAQLLCQAFAALARQQGIAHQAAHQHEEEVTRDVADSRQPATLTIRQQVAGQRDGGQHEEPHDHDARAQRHAQLRAENGENDEEEAITRTWHNAEQCDDQRLRNQDVEHPPQTGAINAIKK
jgi:hypothetical protein